MFPADSSQLLVDPYYLNIERRLTRLSLCLGLVILSVLLSFASLRAVVGFMAGSVLSYYNFIWMKQAVDRLLTRFQPSGSNDGSTVGWSKGGRRVIFKYFIRFALIGGSLYAIFRFQILDLKAFALGLFLFVMAVLVEGIYQVTKTIIEDWDRGRT
jgi:hypothetical protein